ncbi:MAG: hypothetical protein U0893_09375 [Chloroflexota bacterium]
MTPFARRCLALGLLLVVAAFVPLAPVGEAAPLSAPDAVFGAATGTTEDEGEMTPTGNGRFTVDDRIYVGKVLGRSVAPLAAACFTGDIRSVEEWSLDSARMAGTHESAVTIRSDRGVLSLRLRGQMEQFQASGTWEITRSTGGCSPLDGSGKYTATYSPAKGGPNLRLTFDGEAES